MTDKIRARVRAFLGAKTERWYAGLATDLVANCWSELISLGFDQKSYSASRLLRLDPSASREGHMSVDAGWKRPLLVECFDDTMRSHYGSLGLRRAPPETFCARAFEEDLSRAMSLLDRVKPVGATIRTLVWSVTPLGVEGPDYDTGYSDPRVPLSIFIGVHSSADGVSPIRLAEGVLHEAMHLQLSLVEDVVPLVSGSGDWRPSPWQGRLRPMQGLLHGLYVFRVVQDYLRAAVAAGRLTAADHRHALIRIEQIDDECAQLAGLSESNDLTADGAKLAAALQA
jgi:HEXXH motif-containing protein